MRLWRLWPGPTTTRSLPDLLPRLLLSKSAREAIESETSGSPLVETGGILIGHVEEPLTLRVTAASGPGPGAIRTATHFVRDTAYCRRFLQERYDADGADYIGDWHSHLPWVAALELSGGDVVTLLGTANDPDYASLPGFAKILSIHRRSETRARLAGRGTKPNFLGDSIFARVELKGYIALRDSIVEVTIEDFDE